MHYNPESNKKNPTKLSDRAREIANNSRILNELRDEYDDRPEEESALGMGYGGKMKGNDMDDRLEQRIKFEEDNFIRKTMSKQDKKLLNTVNKRGGVLRFQNEFQVFFFFKKTAPLTQKNLGPGYRFPKNWRSTKSG